MLSEEIIIEEAIIEEASKTVEIKLPSIPVNVSSNAKNNEPLTSNIYRIDSIYVSEHLGNSHEINNEIRCFLLREYKLVIKEWSILD